MNILFVTPWLQHPAARGSCRCYYLLKGLSERHQVTMLSPVTGQVPDGVLDDIQSYARQVFTFPTGWLENTGSRYVGGALPARARRGLGHRKVLARMKEKLNALAEGGEYDLVLLHGKAVFPVVKDFDRLPVVIDACDATSLRIRQQMALASPLKRLLLSYRYIQTRQLEGTILRKTPHLAIISYRDREALGQSEILILPNGVDSSYWKRTSQRRRPRSVVFTGVMNYRPNEDAATYLMNDILPRLWKRFPGLTAAIAGRDPTPRLIRRAQAEPRITVTGSVPDIRPYLEDAEVFVAPLRAASGMQNKVLEAMAMEVPVVCTSIVAAGIRVESAQAPVVVADRKEAIAEAVADLLENPREASRIGAEGRRYVVDHFTWEKTTQRLEGLCWEAVREARGTRQKSSVSDAS